MIPIDTSGKSFYSSLDPNPRRRRWHKVLWTLHDNPCAATDSAGQETWKLLFPYMTSFFQRLPQYRAPLPFQKDHAAISSQVQSQGKGETGGRRVQPTFPLVSSQEICDFKDSDGKKKKRKGLKYRSVILC